MTDLSVVPDEVVPSLAECEEVIERGLHSFVEVGQALMTIRDAGLYSRDFDTFEDYCKERWGFVRTRAYQFIDAAEVSKNLDTHAIPPRVESHAAALVPLHKKDPGRVSEAWSRAIEKSGGKPTAKVIKEVVSEYVPPKKKKPKKPEAKPDPASLDDQARLSRLYSSLEYLARMGVSPEYLVDAVPDEQAHLVKDFIDQALDWLESFHEAWNDKRYGAYQ